MTARCRLAPVVLVGALALAGGPAVATDDGRALLDQKLRLVERLLARNDAAHAGTGPYESASVLLQSARVYLDMERFDLVAQALDEALRLAGEMARKTPALQRNADALAERLAQLEDGTRTFRQSYLEATGEHGEHDAEAQWLLALARRHADAGDHRQAVESAAQAYELTARALAVARANETVEYRLVFATPADEYAYELERFRSNGLLVQLFVNERAPGGEQRIAIDADVERARQLNVEAQMQAGAGDIEHAIRLLEQASSRLMRALSRAGLFIPR